MSVYPPLNHMLELLNKRYPLDERGDYLASYEEDLRKATKPLCKLIRCELEWFGDEKSAAAIVKCLRTEINHIESLNTGETICTILKEFTSRFLSSDKGKEEAMRLITGEYEVESDSENSDCDSLCSSCESSEKRARDGYHRMRMAIREMAGPGGRRTGVALRKNIRMHLVRKMN